MASSNSRKHARKVTLDAAVNNAIEKAVDARKVAAFTVGAAGVLAGAAFAFGATPAMAAEAGAAAPTDAAQTPVAAGEKAGKKADAGEAADGKADAKSEVKEDEAKEADKENQTGEKDQTDTNKEVGEQSAKKEDTTEEQNKQSVAKTEDKKSDEEEKKQETTVVGQNREVSATPESKPQSNSTIELSEDKKDTLPNMYAWGKSDNVYVESGQNTSVTFKFAKPTDGSTITKVAIFPSDTNGVDNAKSRGFLEYYSDPNAKDEHQSYSGTYDFKANNDGSATLTMTKLYRDGGLKGAQSYAANRCIYVYGNNKEGKEVLLYKTNIVRAATLIPPKTAGSIVLQYDEQLTDEQIRARLKQALDAPTEAKDGKSVSEQIVAASKSKGVGGRTGANGAFVQTPDNPDKKVIINDQQAYLPTQLQSINTVTSQADAKEKTYKLGAQTLKTYLVSDLGYKSEALPLTVARYDTRIDKPIVDEVDITKLTDDQKAEICKKLAQLNHVTQDKVTFNDKGEAVINFDGVDEKDAPKIALSDLVLKKFEEKDVAVPTGEKAVFVANPLAYSDAEIKSIKKAIYEANKDKKELGLTEADYENQISLSYLTGNLTASGTGNQGISNGQAENTITVKIKTDKAVAEFKSDVKARKLTKLPDIRKDYDVTWTKDKIDGRDTDEGISWSNDQKTTIIYRYDPTKAEEFDTNKILGLLKATPKNPNSGLRDLTGGEQLAYEGIGNNAKKSHVGYVLKDNQPTTELSLGNMNGAYWEGVQKVSDSDVNLGDNLSIAGSYSWDKEAGPVTVAGKKDKIFKARLFVLPYGLTMYRNIYMENGNQPWNTPKAINVIFVPQTNHKTKDLSKSIDEHKTTQVEGKDIPTESKYYNASADKKKSYDDALSKAKTLYDSVKDTDESKLTEEQKAQIDNATINLNKAREALDGDATKKEELQKSIDENGTAAAGTTAATGTQATNQFKNVSDPDFKKADGSDDTDRNNAAREAKKAYDKALEDAKALKDDENATQKAVDEAKAKLDEARKKLNDFTTNKDELSAAIAKDGKVNTGKTESGTQDVTKADPTYQNSTKEERDAYDNAVAEAQKVVADPNASQKEVNDAIKKLKDAKSKLDAKATDKSKLAAAEKQSFDNPDTSDESKQSVFYKNALTKKTSGTAAEKAKAAAAIKAYDDALDKAREVLKNEKATQAQVDEAKKKLEEAEKALHEGYKSDDNDLTKAIANNVSGYLMPAYFNAFDQAQKDGADSQAAKDFKTYNDAYQKAKELSKKLKETEESKKPSQDEIDKAKTALEEARKVIDKYATDTSKISAALLHSLAIKASPAYQNASAGAEGSDEAKAKKAYDDALAELQKAFNDQMDKDKGDNGAEIPESVIPDKDIDMTNANALKKLQAHAKGQPLNRDVTKLLEKLNDAVKGLDKFATKTDELINSINEHDNTKQTPAYKNASLHDYKQEDGTTADTTRNDAAKKAVDEYGEALNQAKDLLKNPSATQKEVNDALQKLNEKRAALNAYNTDVTKLKESVRKNGKEKQGDTAATEGTVTSDAYRNASDPHFVDENGTPDEEKNKQAREAKTAYDKALAEAQALLEKHNDDKTPQDAKPTQAEINDALKALDEARTKLDDYKTNAEALKDEAAKSTADGSIAGGTDFENMPEFKNADAKKGEDNEDNDDVKAYKDALKNARDLVKAATEQGKKNSERPTQQQINDALEALKNAKKQITDNYKTNAAALKAAKDFAAGDFKKTPEYKNADALKDDASAAPEKKNTAKADVDALDKNTNDSALEKAIEILRAFDDNGKPKQEGPTGGRIPTQKEVDEALQTLQKAMDKVTNGYKTNADKLNNEVGDKDQDGNPVVPAFEASVPYKNALEKAKTEEDKTSDTSATKKLEAYNEKLKAAQDLIAQVNSTDPNADPDKKPTQKQVDEALAALKKAKQDLADAFKTNASALKNEAEDKDEHGNAKADKDKFEKSTEYQNALAKTDADSKKDVQTYRDALKKANELLELFGEDGNPKADIPAGKQIPTQQEVDAAKKALKEIKDKILANYKTSPVELQKEVDKSKNGEGDTSTDVFENTPAFKNADAAKDGSDDNADMKAYKEALKAAKAMLEKFDRATGKPKKGATDVPTQAKLDEALKALQDAKKKIEDNYSTVKSDLRTEAGDDFTKSPEYQNAQAKGDDESKQALDEYKNALDEANSVLADPNATQAEVDAALKRLQDAKAKLKAGNSTDKSKLQDEADDDANFRKSPYFIIGNKADIEAYEDALAEAKSVLNDPNATQAQVDAALKKLAEAKKRILDFLSHFGGSGNGTGDWNGYGFVNGHESYGALVDKTALQIEVNNAVETNANTAEAVAYRQALAEARSVLNDPNATQAQVDAALRKLAEAKAALLNSLSGASGHKIAKTGAATGLFAGFAAIFAGLGAAGVASRRRKHSNE